MAAPQAPSFAKPTTSFSSIVRAAAREASASAQEHIEAVVASALAQRSNVASRFNKAVAAMPGRQLVLVELDEQGRPIARHLIPAPAPAPKSGCYSAPAPPPLRVAVGRAGGRERDERRRRGEAAAASAASAAAAAAQSSSSSSSSITAARAPPPVVTGAVSTLRLRLSHESVSAQQAVLLISHRVEAPPTQASSAATRAAKVGLLSMTPLSVCGAGGCRNPTLLLRHSWAAEGAAAAKAEAAKAEAAAAAEAGAGAAAAAEAGAGDDENAEKPKKRGRKKREPLLTKKGRDHPAARLIGPGQTARLKLGDVLVFGGRAVVVEAEATAGARRAGVPLGEAFAARNFRGGASAANVAAVGAGAAVKGPPAALGMPPRPPPPPGAKAAAPPPLPPKPKPPLAGGSGIKDDPMAAPAVSGAAAAAALAAAAASRARRRREARARAALQPLLPPPAPLDPTVPPPLCVRLSSSVANDPFCASLAERARLPLAAPGDLSSWSVFVVRGPGEGEGAGFSRSLNWLLSLAGRRAVVSPAWLAEAARVVEEKEAEEKGAAEAAEEAEEGSSKVGASAKRRKGKDGAAAAAAAAAAAPLENPSSSSSSVVVAAPPTAPFALRDPAAETRGKFSLAPELLCGWDDGKIPISSAGNKEAALAAAAAGAAAAEEKGLPLPPPPPPPPRPARLCDGVTVAPSSALLACESDNGGMLCALIEAAGGFLVRPVRTRNDGKVTAEVAAEQRAAREREARARAAVKEAASAAAAAAASAASAAAAAASAGAKTPGGAPSAAATAAAAAAAASASAAAAAATPLFAATPVMAAAGKATPATPASNPAITASPGAGGGEGAARKRKRTEEEEVAGEWLGLACSADSAKERAWARENLPKGTRVLSRTAFVDAVIRQRLPAPESKGVLFLAGE